MDDPHPLRAICALSAPLVAFFLIQNLVGLAALALVGRIGDVALAGIGLGNVLYALLLALLYGVDTGAQASIARAAGAGAPALAGRMLTNALALGAPLGALLALIAAFLLDPRSSRP
jgi:Na+-driven multidrug efflux pump